MRITIPTLPIAALNPSAASRPAISVEAAAERVASFLAPRRALVITGAGVSVDSGIRAYRGADGHYSNPNYKPIFYQELADPGAKGKAFRQRYWSRSYIGYPPVRDALPNPNHYAIAALQYLDVAPRLITQNVDGLHNKASPFDLRETRKRNLELHGTLHTVHCNRGHLYDRMEFQHWLSDLNPSWKELMDDMERTGNKPRTNPDGDVDIEGVKFDDFIVPQCTECLKEGHSDSIMKPNLIFFGESIPSEVRDASFKMVNESERVLIIGSTLATYSAFRLAKLAVEHRKPVLMLNVGPSRSDSLPQIEKIDSPSRDVLLGACRLLGGPLISHDETLERLLSSGVVMPPDTSRS